MRINTKVVWDMETGEIIERESYDYTGPVASCDPATLTAIASIIGASVAVGGEAYSLSNQPSTPKATTAPVPLTTTQNSGQTAAVAQQLPTLQSLTGGSLSPEYAANFGALNSGVTNDPQATGNIQSAINSFFGLTAPGSSGLTSTPTSGGGGGILDLLKPQGSSSPISSPSAISSWVQSVLNGNQFQGLQATG